MGTKPWFYQSEAPPRHAALAGDRARCHHGRLRCLGRPHETRLRVRYGETDQMGIVHHANYLLYFEEGRTRMMGELGCSYAELERRGWVLPVRKAQMRFRASARYEDELIVQTSVARLGGASVEFRYEVRDARSGALLADGSTELACMDQRGGERKVALLPEELRAVLEPFVAG